MAQLDESFDPSKVDLNTGGGYFPAGKYVAEIVDTKYEKKDSGYAAIKLKLKVVVGEKEGKHFFLDITRRSTNEQAMAIGNHQLAFLLAAIGHQGNLTDTEQLHGKIAVFELEVQEGKDKPGGGKYDPRNRLKTYRGIEPYGKQKPAQAPKQDKPVEPAKQQEPVQQEAKPEPVASVAAADTPDWMK